MKKVEINIAPDEWGHLTTKYSPKNKRLSNGDFTDGTVNVDTDVNGSLTKRKGDVNYNVTLLAAASKDQFEAIFSDGTRHLLVVQSGEIKYSSGDGVFNTIVNGTGFSVGGNFEFATTQDRVYLGNGINNNQVYDRSTSYGGVAYTAPRLREMGVAAPGSAPTVAVVAGGAVPVGSHTYKITFVYHDNEESNGGPASAVATTSPGNQTVNLSSVAIGGYGVTARKIYRDDNDGLWLHVGTIANNTATTFSDVLAVGVTPTEIPEDNGTSPSFRYISLWLDRLFTSGVPGDPYTLFYSEPEWPDIFRSENQILCNQEDPITGTIVYFDRLIVFNRKSFGQILGSTPDTFRYAAIPSSIGCVDNRTIQIRVIEGVPILIWLSDKGFYSYNGNSIDYISEPIEDLVNFNIQQALQQKNSNSQSSFGGTAEDGIDASLLSSQITTRGYLNGAAVAGNNPRRNWDDTGDWETAVPLNIGWTPNSNVNTRTKDGDNALRVPTRYAETSFANGTHAGTEGTTALSLDTSLDYDGEAHTGPYTPSGTQLNGDTATSGFDELATPFIPLRSGNLTAYSFDVTVRSLVATFYPQTWPIEHRIYNDVGGLPGTAIASLGNQNVTIANFTVDAAGVDVTASRSGISVPIIAGQKYWIVMRWGGAQLSGGTVLTYRRVKISTNNWSGGLDKSYGRREGGPWSHIEHSATDNPIGIMAGSITVCSTPIAASGVWTSPIFDSKSIFVGTGMSINHTGTYSGASQCSGTPIITGQTTVEGSNSPTFSGGAEVTQTISNLNGTSGLTISGKRYWRIKIALTTSDNRVTPTAGLPTLFFNTTATWESETIDTTAQVTTYNSLVTSASIPAGTSVTTEIATSASPTGPWTYVSFGSHVVRQYVRIKLTLTTDGTNTTTPIVSSVILKWTLSAKYTSTVIDTGVTPPAGWDIFLADFSTNGGTVAFEFASSSAPGGPFVFSSVTPGNFPTNAPFQYAQWRVTITSSDEDVPIVDSVTTQWFISSVSSIRPASIFTDGRYYVSLAEVGETVNNILLELDLNGKWRRLAGLNISTFSFFFNRPYFGLGTAGRIRKFLEGFTDAGTNIVFDLRTKAFDFSTTQYDDHSNRLKIVGEIIIEGEDTGAVFTAFYSVDEGENFYPLLTNSGSTTFSLGRMPTRLKPDWNAGNPIDGYTILYKIFNEDENEVQIDRIKVNALVREQKPVVTN